jgi:hypothetical protein
MRTSTLILIAVTFALASLAAPASAGTVHMRPYFSADKSEFILVWDEATGKSKGWYFSRKDSKFTPSAAKYQLPANPGITSNVMMAPYLTKDKSEVVLVWDKKKGDSVSWYFSNSKKKFIRSDKNYQLPKQAGKEVMMAPYLSKDGTEVVLVWDAATGKSVSWYFSTSDKKFKKSEPGFQLPQELGLTGRIMMRPYIAKDGTEVIHTWSVTNGKSNNFYYSNSKKKFVPSDKGYQIPADPGVKSNVWMIPYIGNDGTEIILAWSASSGKSVSWYYSNSDKAYKISADKFQLPASPIHAKATMMVPYIDTGASEVILVWDAKTGASKGYYFSNSDKKMMPAGAGYQLPGKAL